jgi:hypothetical protein
MESIANDMIIKEIVCERIQKEMRALQATVDTYKKNLSSINQFYKKKKLLTHIMLLDECQQNNQTGLKLALNCLCESNAITSASIKHAKDMLVTILDNYRMKLEDCIFEEEGNGS